MAPRSTLAVLFLAVTACSDATAPEDGLVGGVDLDALFAPPTASEIAAVEGAWADRSTDAVDVSVHLDSTVTVEASDFRVRIVSHRVGSILHYGAVLTPGALSAPAPILVYAHAGDTGVSVDEILFLLPFLGDVSRGFVWVIPSFRAEALSFGASEWISEAPPARGIGTSTTPSRSSRRRWSWSPWPIPRGWASWASVGGPE
ncbi:MAG: hypothetical protein R3304_13510 [Longimicrobiales bacterium]|nr:hypothetical protein [Longimicrobiales bacterium]